MRSFPLILTLLTLLLFVFAACTHEHHEGDGHDHGHDEHQHGVHGDVHGHAPHEEGLFLTTEQANTIGLQLGQLSSIKVNDFIKATGTLGLPPNGYASVSTKTDGIIRATQPYVEGDYLKKGTVLAYLENPEFIRLQQAYLEALAQLKFKRLEVERQQTLVNAEAGVAKQLQEAQAAVAVLEAKTQGLSKQLSFLGLPTNILSPSTIRQRVAITAPMSGYVSNINFHNGLYAQSSVALMEILALEHLHLELDVFEKDIAQLKKGQKISYTVPALGSTIYYGSVDVIGKEFNEGSKTVRVHGRLEGSKPTFIKDLFLNAKIFLNDVETTALPEAAIIRAGNNSFIYVAQLQEEQERFAFEPIHVVVGATDNGYTAIELIDPIPEGMQLVTKGAYYVYAQSKAGELAHEH